MDAHAGIDLGATRVRAAVGDPAGAVAGRARAPTPDGPGEAVAERAVRTLRRACDDAGVAPDALAAVGVGTAGPLDQAGRAVVDPPNLPGVERIPVAAAVEAAAGTDRVVLLNDAAAGALGERVHAEDPPANLVYLTLSTGIGAGAVVDGSLLAGRDGNAAEVGHLVVNPAGGRPCGCGGTGHWEAYCSGRAIPEYARDLAAPGADTALALGEPDLDAAAVFARAGDDPLAARVVERVARYNAVGMADVVHSFAPAEVVVGGAVALGNEALVVEPLRERVPDMVVVRPPAVRLPALGERAVVTGALVAAGGRGG